jgi:hypothetical protein
MAVVQVMEKFFEGSKSDADLAWVFVKALENQVLLPQDVLNEAFDELTAHHTSRQQRIVDFATKVRPFHDTRLCRHTSLKLKYFRHSVIRRD